MLGLNRLANCLNHAALRSEMVPRIEQPRFIISVGLCFLLGTLEAVSIAKLPSFSISPKVGRRGTSMLLVGLVMSTRGTAYEMDHRKKLGLGILDSIWN